MTLMISVKSTHGFSIGITILVQRDEFLQNNYPSTTSCAHRKLPYTRYLLSSHPENPISLVSLTLDHKLCLGMILPSAGGLHWMTS